MRNHPLIIASALMGIVIFLTHMGASIFLWYIKYPVIDIPLHFVGGLWVAITALWFFYFSSYSKNIVFSHFSVIFIAIAIGIGWELFEYIFKSYNANEYVLDTSLDILMDTLGAVVAVIIVKIMNQRMENLLVKQKTNVKN